jgi:outer membrane protein assembly factor BamB
MISIQNEVFTAQYYLDALNLSGGEVLWSFASGIGPAPPMSSNRGLVYLGSNLGALVEFNPVTGQAEPFSDQAMVLASSAICDNVAFVTSVAGFGYPSKPTSSMLAIDLNTGATLLSVNLTSGQFQGFPTMDGRLVYSTITNNTVVALTTSSSQLVWKRSFSQNIIDTPPLVNGELLVTTADGHVYALNSTDGNEVWSTNLGEGTDSSASVGYGEMFLGSSDSLFALSLINGSILWKAELGSSSSVAPTVVDGSVFVADNNGTIYQFQASNGTLLWHFSGLGVGYVSEPIVTEGLVVIDGNNGVFAFH